ncbi:aspartate 1-decarboxylase [Sinorhizobium chiapasense]|uniref:Aspartate 1-decarboxylase n=1 Tax=Sinorhizobium chiapasense TaxID=501572 RepID=A0ABZ2BKH1_9HYPH
MTDAKLNYHGSITIDADFCRAARICRHLVPDVRR